MRPERKRHLAAGGELHLRSDSVSDLHMSDLKRIYAKMILGITRIDTRVKKERYDGVS